jgi:hypothetical protein
MINFLVLSAAFAILFYGIVGNFLLIFRAEEGSRERSPAPAMNSQGWLTRIVALRNRLGSAQNVAKGRALSRN